MKGTQNWFCSLERSFEALSGKLCLRLHTIYWMSRTEEFFKRCRIMMASHWHPQYSTRIHNWNCK
jgi:hypothetical protein